MGLVLDFLCGMSKSEAKAFIDLSDKILAEN